jgi:purine-cytosine permease-like protein
MSQFNSKERREDYALQVVPDSYRRWGWLSLFSIVLGASTAMLFFAWGSDLMQAYGAKDLILGMVISTLFIGTVGFILTTISAKTGLDIDLITSGAGFGYKGAGFTSLIYACSMIFYFAMESSIIASAIHAALPVIPLGVLYVVVGAIFIPLTWYGVTALNYTMWITLPIYLILLAWSIKLAIHLPSTTSFLSFTPLHPANPAAGPPLLQLLAACLPVITLITPAVDIGRFIPKQQRVIAVITSTYLMCAIGFLGAAILGAWLGLKLKESNPGIYFPALLGVWGVLFVVLTQMRINVINAYTSSLALTTFFSRIFNFSPGRHWWIITMVAISIACMFGNLLAHLLAALTFLGVFVVAWIMAVVADLLFNKNIFKISATNFAFQKGTIPNFNPVGLSALVIALIVSVPMAFGICGPLGKTLAPFVAAVLAFTVVPIASWIININGGLQRKSRLIHPTQTS